MTPEPTSAAPRGVHGSVFEQLDTLVKKRRQLLEAIDVELAVEKRTVAKAKARRAEKTKPLLDELKQLDEGLTKLLIARKRSLWHRFGKTISLPDGVIRYRTDAKSLDTPRNTTAIIYFLRGKRGGNRYLTWTPSLNRDAITNSDSSLLAKLKPLGVWVGRHAIITIKSTGQEEPTTLDRRRFPNR